MKIFKMVLLIILIIILVLSCYFFVPLEIPFLTGFVGFSKEKKDIVWGVNFSQKHAQNFGLDWKKAYSAILDDLAARNIKLATYWDFIEDKQGEYFFGDLDWQVKEAEKRGAKLILVIGMKTPCWPECHIPNWAKNLNKEEQQEKILSLIKEIVLRYQGSEAIKYWQVENEPFFPFGQCPWKDSKFLKKEIELVKSLDPVRDSEGKEKTQREQISNGVDPEKSVIISESGEFSFWFSAARYGDIVGVTMYKKVWMSEIKSYFNYFFPPIFYNRRALLIKNIFKKEIICVELQAEPWGPKLLYDLPLEEQEKTMNLERFKKNIEFAKKTGLSEFYLWGAEWMYWLKEKQGRPEIWQEAKKLF